MSHKIDVIGQRYDLLTPSHQLTADSKKAPAKFCCTCTCGGVVSVTKKHLIDRRIWHCCGSKKCIALNPLMSQKHVQKRPVAKNFGKLTKAPHADTARNTQESERLNADLMARLSRV